MYQDNPYTYKVGDITDAVSVQYGKGLVLRIQPAYTYSLFTEDILFCGVPLGLFQGKTNPMVLTYKTQASRMINGVGCHELIHVDQIKTKELP